MTTFASASKRVVCAMGLLLVLLMTMPAGAAPSAADSATGVLVVAPDRGFLGNEEVRDAFDRFARQRNARLLFVTDMRSGKIFDEAWKDLLARGAKRIDVLPLVMSTDDARWQLAEGWLQERRRQGADVVVARPYGASYLAVEDLSARLRRLHGDRRHLLLVGYGAGSPAAADSMRRHLERMAGFASTLDPDAVKAVVYPARKADKADVLRRQVGDAIRNAHGAVVVPVAFAPRDDSMMDFSHWFTDQLPKDAQMVTSPLATTDALAQWMQRAAAEADLRAAPAKPSEVGVVVLAHGADWFWNHAIEQALAPVAARHTLAYAFSMADPPVVERAVRKLEKRHVRAIVVVRAFGMAASFRPTVRRMIGADVEGGAMSAGSGHHGMGMMHHGMAEHASLAAPPRIRTALPMVTVGGVEDDPLLARSLLRNAHSVSKDPSRETVILVAHGQGEDAANQRWLDLLASLARQMRADGGNDFRAIRYATWREDWPDKRKVAVAHVRRMVEQARQDGGRALIVPARINGRGAADRYLDGLDFGWSQGFAQTPYFAEWFEQEIDKGIRKLNAADATERDTARHGH